MKPEAERSRAKEVIEKLRNLVQVNVDCHEGFQKAAGAIDSPDVAAMFRELALERSAHSDELQALIAAHGVGPRRDASTDEAIRRYILDFRAALNGGDPSVILAEAERTVDHIEELYENVLPEYEDAADDPAKRTAYDILHRQYRSVVRSYDRVRALRNTYKR